MTPFFECVSAPGAAFNDCGNCLYRQVPCSYRFNDNEERTQALKTKLVRRRADSGGGIPSALNGKTAIRASVQVPNWNEIAQSNRQALERLAKDKQRVRADRARRKGKTRIEITTDEKVEDSVIIAVPKSKQEGKTRAGNTSRVVKGGHNDDDDDSDPDR